MLSPPPRADTLADVPDQHAQTWRPDRASLAAEAAGTLPVVPGYQVISLIGSGAMGRVYKALHLGLQRHDAIKMVTFGADDSVVQRFRVEARALGKVNHPNIAQIYDVGEASGQPFLAMEFVAGGNLAEYLRGRPQDPRFAARLVETLARAVEHCHHEGILHRDLKPGNILLDGELTPKITDFGLAKLLVHATQQQTRTGDILGTPGYMAPEQASGTTSQPTAAVDIYALGAILYECLTGRPPFQAPEVFQTLMLVLTQDPVPPSRLLPKLPRDINTICLACLHKTPRRRYPTAAALADDLRRFLDGQPIHARPVSRPERAWKWLRRHPAWASILILGLALLATITTSLIQVTRANHALLQAKRAADSNLDRAGLMIEKLIQDHVLTLPATPQGERQQRRELEEAKRHFEALAQLRQDDREGRTRLLQNLLTLSRLEIPLGQYDEAEQTLARAGSLVQASRDHADQVHLLSVLHERMILAQQRGQDDGLRSLLAQATTLDQALSSLPQNVTILEERIRHAALAGRIASRDRQPARAEEQYRLALSLLDQLAKDWHYPADAKIVDFAIAYSNLGSALVPQKKFTEAAEVFAKARSFLPDDGTPRCRELLGQIQSNQGVVAEERKRPADAERAYAAAAYLFERLGDDYPTIPDYRYNWVKVKLNHTVLQALQGKAATTRPTLAAVRPVLEKLCTDHPQNATYQAELKRLNTLTQLVDQEIKRPAP